MVVFKHVRSMSGLTMGHPVYYPRHPFFVRTATLPAKGLHLCESYPEISLDGVLEMEEHDPDEICVGLLKVRDTDGHELVILLQDRLCSVRGYHRQLSAHVYLHHGRSSRRSDFRSS